MTTAKVLASRDRSDHGRAFDELVGGAVPSTPGDDIRTAAAFRKWS
jgi:hypothetical protein